MDQEHVGTLIDRLIGGVENGIHCKKDRGHRCIELTRDQPDGVPGLGP